MFLPKDLTPSERGLAAELKRQVLAHRAPTGPEEERQALQEADELAAEMINQARAAAAPEEQEDVEPAESGYHARLRARLAREQAILDEEASGTPLG